MRLRLRFPLAAALVVVVTASAACGGGSTTPTAPGGVPTLLGTVLPTATSEPPTVAVCQPATQLALPANFPTEILVPSPFAVWDVQTTPYLHVEGRTNIRAAIDEQERGQARPDEPPLSVGLESAAAAIEHQDKTYRTDTAAVWMRCMKVPQLNSARVFV